MQAPEDEWQEVVHEETGRTYYWNQKTGGAWYYVTGRYGCLGWSLVHMGPHIPPAGETTDLGEPKPKTRFRQHEGSEGFSTEGSPFQESWREPPEPDRTQVCMPAGLARRGSVRAQALTDAWGVSS